MSSSELLDYIKKFNENVDKGEIANNVAFFKNHFEMRKNIRKNEDALKQQDEALVLAYINKYDKHKEIIKNAIKEPEKDEIISVDSDVVFSGERFLKNAAFSTILGIIFASFFTFRGDDLD